MENLLKPEIKKGLNDAIGRELYAHNLYLNLANQMQGIGYFGAQTYFLHESKEEMKHYQSLVDYINDRGDVASIPMIPVQSDKATSLMDAFEVVYETEHDLELFYVELYEKAEDKMDDCVTAQFLLQFLEIQRKSVGEVKDIISMLKIAGNNTAALLIIDEKLKK